MSHLEGWQRHGEARELGQNQSCRNPLIQNLPEPECLREACRQRSARVPRWQRGRAGWQCQCCSANVPCHAPTPWGAAFTTLFFIRMSAPIC